LLSTKMLIVHINELQEDLSEIFLWCHKIHSLVGTELMLEVRHMIWSQVIASDGSTLIWGKNMSEVSNTSVPSSVLQEKHDAIAYHGLPRCTPRMLFSL
jgi:hypothetical protein